MTYFVLDVTHILSSMNQSSVEHDGDRILSFSRHFWAKLQAHI